MEWVTISAATVEDAKMMALDQLGVASEDAEIEVLEEPRSGLFGRTRGEAKVRARVKPTSMRTTRRERGERSPRGERGAGRSPSRSVMAVVTVDVVVVKVVATVDVVVAAVQRTASAGRAGRAMIVVTTSERNATIRRVTSHPIPMIAAAPTPPRCR